MSRSRILTSISFATVVLLAVALFVFAAAGSAGSDDGDTDGSPSQDLASVSPEQAAAAASGENADPERFLFYVEGLDIDLLRAQGVDLATHQALDEQRATGADGEPAGIRLTLRSSEVIERVVVAQAPAGNETPGLVIEVTDVVLPDGITIDAHRICVSQAGSPGLSEPGDLDPAINAISANGWNPTELVDFLDSTGGINLVVDQVWVEASELEMDWIYSSTPAMAEMAARAPELPPSPCDR
jgi:hypothetical protein